MIGETTRVVEDGMVRHPIGVDAVFLVGYGVLHVRTRPVKYAGEVRAWDLVRRITANTKEDACYWKVARLLAKMVADGTAFTQLNEEA